MKYQRFSPFRYNFNELTDAMIDPVINHYYFGKMQHEKKCKKQVIQWLKYANMTGYYKNLKLKYPNPFECEKMI